MAKTSTIIKNNKRKQLIDKQAKKRAELRKKVVDENLSDDDREEAMIKLNKLNRNGCPTRHRNRCYLTGRSRGYYRKFNLSRIKLRELALRGIIPGVTKASW
ncbi:MAG: 30S ribosomal protein S14 [Halobacteriovoraceae bacterium]|nr:30S ribosomal protein S14 [Halobacteriovoraceae bacterium]